MKVLEYKYKDTRFDKPSVLIQSGIFRWTKRRTYVCISVGFATAHWVNIGTGESVDKSSELYELLNRTGTKMQIEAKDTKT